MGEQESEKILFPTLETLELENLPKILAFCHAMSIELPSLEKIEIERSPLMEKFVQGHSDVSSFFSKEVAGNSFNCIGLRELKVEGVHNFKCLFSPSISGFPNLRILIVRDCSKLEEVIGKGENMGEEESKKILFPRLEILELENLANILTFCHAMSVELPSLESLRIKWCPLMERFVQGLYDVSAFFSKEVDCPKLEWLTLSGLHNIAGIFSPPTSRALVNLNRLNLHGCKGLKEVIAKEEVERPTNTEEILFPQLKYLTLQELPEIIRFCQMKHSLEFPSLEEVRIDDCPTLERFCCGHLHLPKFRSMKGLLDANSANKIFFGTEISLENTKPKKQISFENNCFTISPRELSINSKNIALCGDELKWFVAPDSSFVDAIQLPSKNAPVEITGKIDTTELQEEVVYEILFMIMLEKNGYW